jgi:hypothetical protein
VMSPAPYRSSYMGVATMCGGREAEKV